LTVKALLDAAGIRCSGSELEELVENYSLIKRQIEELYEAAYADADPLLILASDR
jgi:hypothetical protein